jgi:hypothetical protein
MPAIKDKAILKQAKLKTEESAGKKNNYKILLKDVGIIP